MCEIGAAVGPDAERVKSPRSRVGPMARPWPGEQSGTMIAESGYGLTGEHFDSGLNQTSVQKPGVPT